MGDSHYHACTRCGKLVDRRRFPESEPCPYCLTELNPFGEKTYKGSSARRLPGVTDGAIAAAKTRRIVLDQPNPSRMPYLRAALIIVTLPILFFYATPRLYLAEAGPVFDTAQYLQAHQSTFATLAALPEVRSGEWPAATSAINAVQQQNMLAQANGLLKKGRQSTAFLATLFGFLAALFLAKLNLDAAHNPRHRHRTTILSLAVLALLLSANAFLARHYAQRQTEAYANYTAHTQTLLDLLLYTALAKNDPATAMRHLERLDPHPFRDQQGATFLHAAAANGVTPLIERLLLYSMDVNVTDNSGLSPLHHAARRGQIHAGETLLANGADPHLPDTHGNTPLHYAVQRANPAFTRILIDTGANPNATNKDQDAPIHLAAKTVSADTLNLLIETGISLDTPNAAGWTPLQIVFRHLLDTLYPSSEPVDRPSTERAQAILRLLQHGASPNVQDARGQTPLHWLRATLQTFPRNTPGHELLGNLTLALFEHGAGRSITDNDANPAYTLHHAAQLGQLQCAAPILEEEPQAIHVTCRDGKTPLQHAVENGHADVAAWLLQRGANFNNWVSKDGSPLAYAIEKSDLELLNLILQHHTIEPTATVLTETPIQRAARLGNAHILTALLQQGFPPNQPNNQGDTPLHIAVRHGHAPAVRTLLQHGADITAWNRQGKTPLDLAQEANQRDITWILRRLPGTPPTPPNIPKQHP